MARSRRPCCSASGAAGYDCTDVVAVHRELAADVVAVHRKPEARTTSPRSPSAAPVV